MRADEPDSVHAMRVATRRLRSALKTYGSLLTTPTKPVRDELRWLAAELGEARDAEVLRDRLVQSVASLDHAPEEQPADPAATGAVPQLVVSSSRGLPNGARPRPARLDSERYQSLLDVLQDLVERPQLSDWPPQGAHGAAEAGGEVVRLAGRPRPPGPARRRRDRARRAAARGAQGRQADPLRGRGRRRVFGKDAKRFAKAVTELQEVLGEHQDSVGPGSG